jgi:DNA-directed RNA polymerase specialized sigma24 family protein
MDNESQSREMGCARVDVLALHDALEKLAALSPRQASVVEARFFAGLSVELTAEALQVSPRTVETDWAVARAWLARQLRDTGRHDD